MAYNSTMIKEYSNFYYIMKLVSVFGFLHSFLVMYELSYIIIVNNILGSYRDV